MAKNADYVSWQQFLGVMGLFVGVMLAGIGGMAAWMHSDLSTLNATVGTLREGQAATNAKLDLLISASRR